MKLLVLCREPDRHIERLRADARIELFIATNPADVGPIGEQIEAALYWGFSPAALREVLPHLPNLRWLHSRSAGVETILSPELLQSQAVLTNAQGVYAPSLAEFVVAAMLFFSKQMRRLLAQQAARKWEPFEVEELREKTIGIVGYGGIGRAVAKRACAFEMNVLACRRRAERSSGDTVVDKVYRSDELPELLSRSDYVVACAPLTGETRGMIGAAELSQMKRSAVLINVGRGAVVDETALVRALERGDLRGAALDVFETEPLPASHPFYGMDNVLLSPHSADMTSRWFDDSMDFFLANLNRYLHGDPLEHIVSKAAGY